MSVGSEFDHERAIEPTLEPRNVICRSYVLCGELKIFNGLDDDSFFFRRLCVTTHDQKYFFTNIRLLTCCFHQIRPDAVHNSYSTPLPHEYLSAAALPKAFDWSDVNGVSYLTKSLNQVCPLILGDAFSGVGTFIVVLKSPDT